MITWFQNRRAKFKRDLEEMKKDVEKGGGAVTSNNQTKSSNSESSPHHLISDNVNIRLQPPLPPSVPPPPPPPPGFPLRLPGSLPSLPHPLPLLCLAPHLLQFPFPPLRPASASPLSKSPSPPPPLRPPLVLSQPIKVENTGGSGEN